MISCPRENGFTAIGLEIPKMPCLQGHTSSLNSTNPSRSRLSLFDIVTSVHGGVVKEPLYVTKDNTAGIISYRSIIGESASPDQPSPTRTTSHKSSICRRRCKRVGSSTYRRNGVSMTVVEKRSVRPKEGHIG